MYSPHPPPTPQEKAAKKKSRLQDLKDLKLIEQHRWFSEESVKAHGIPRHGDITLEVHSAPLRWTPGWTKGAIPSMPLAQQWNLRTFGQTQADGNPPVCPYKEQGTIPEDMSTEVPPPLLLLNTNQIHHHASAHHVPW